MKIQNKISTLIAFILIGYFPHTQSATTVDAYDTDETDIQCMYVQTYLVEQLNTKYKKSNKKGLKKRRVRLKKLLTNTTPSCAEKLKRRLGKKVNSSSISELFHQKLSKPVRKQLLKVLERRAKSHAKVIEGDIVIGSSQDQVINLATKAKRILAEVRPTNSNWRSIERLQCIFNGLEAKGKGFDDSYYPVAPLGKNISHTDNPLTCFKKQNSKTKENNCRKGKSVVRHCKKSFSKRLVNHSVAGASDQELLDMMLNAEDEINRGLVYFRNMRTVARNLGGSRDTENTMMCKSAVKYLIPRMKTNHNKDKLYNCYPNP